MPAENGFRHQSYPTSVTTPPQFRTLAQTEGNDSKFLSLHAQHRVARVLLVHGTFVGNDPFAMAETLNAVGGKVPVLSGTLQKFTDSLMQKMPNFTASATKDVGNYTEGFRTEFQRLVGSDPTVELLKPAWSSQNHHFARADLAVQLLYQLIQRPVPMSQRVLLWGHSHAGNAFAILTNLLANQRTDVERFFSAVEQPSEIWTAVRDQLRSCPTPHPLAKQLVIVTFGTPVRYGWDINGCDRLIHVNHHRSEDAPAAITCKPLYPLYPVADVVKATWGDWVQSFAIAGTDVASPTSRSVNARLTEVLEQGLAPPQLDEQVEKIKPASLQTLCARWTTGTRCHTDGLNLLVQYEPSGLTASFRTPLESTLFGHGVYTTIPWLPAHLEMLMDVLKA